MAFSQSLVSARFRDGGYYLIGMRPPLPELFRGIRWGTAVVPPPA